MAPPECQEKKAVMDESWDRCVKRSTVGLMFGSVLGGVSTLLFGTSGFMLSMGLAVTWAVRHCRALFREGGEGSTSLCPKHPMKSIHESCISDNKQMEPARCLEVIPIQKDPCQDLETTPKVQSTDMHVEKCSDTKKEQSFPFPPIFTMPSRPTTRDEPEMCTDESKVTNTPTNMGGGDEIVKQSCCTEETEKTQSDNCSYEAVCTCEGREESAKVEVQMAACTCEEEIPEVSPSMALPSDAECTCQGSCDDASQAEQCTCPTVDPGSISPD